ncbi:MAG: hypothetical protein IIB90_17140 [Gemmatimonadetes bacterium]|nr:hypothetical protein [Gemmatimonadota bacterium]
MRSMHCSACQKNGVPKTCVRSRLAVEVTLWLVGIGMGLTAGGRAIGTSAPHALTTEVQEIALSSVSGSLVAANPVEVATETAYNTDGILFEATAWISDVSFSFIRAFWWTLIIPGLFSLWRQFSKYPGCRACGSKELTPIEIQYN